MAQIQMASDVQKNLVSQGYLHSYTHNFLAATNMGGNLSMFNRDTPYKENLKLKLNDLKDRMEKKEREFYRLFGFNNKNIKISAERFNFYLQKAVSNYKILEELNSPAFYTYLRGNGLLEDEIEKAADIIQESIDKEIYKSFKQSKDKKMTAELMNEISRAFNESKIPLFGVVKKKNKLKKQYTELDTKMTEAFQEIIKQINLSQPKKEVEQISQDYKQEVVLKIENFLRSRGATEELIESVSEVAKSVVYTFSDAALKDNNQQLGTIGEVINSFVLEEVLKTINTNLNKKGKANLALTYTGTKKTLDIFGKSTGKSSPIDFFIGKFGIQSKNTANLSNEGFNDIHVMSSVKLTTFVDRIAESIGPLQANQYQYLVQNIMWLKKHAIGVNGENDLKIGDIPEIMSFITDILALGAEQLLVHENIDIEDINTEHYGNVFFFYRTEFLIPVSLMMEGIINSVDKTLKNETENTGIGYFSSNGISANLDKGKQINLIGGAPMTKNAFLQQKLDALQQDIQTENPRETITYRYPENLVAVGAYGGKSFRNAATVSLKYKFNLKNLVKQVESMYKYV